MEIGMGSGRSLSLPLRRIKEQAKDVSKRGLKWSAALDKAAAEAGWADYNHAKRMLRAPAVCIVHNDKGGSGRTAATSILAAIASAKGCDVKVVDASDGGHLAKYIRYFDRHIDQKFCNNGLSKLPVIITLGSDEALWSVILRERSESDLMVIDVGRQRSHEIASIMSLCDLFLCPTQISDLDIQGVDRVRTKYFNDEFDGRLKVLSWTWSRNYSLFHAIYKIDLGFI
jgi:hypothetical protein